MSLREELEVEVREIFESLWKTRDGTKVPEAEDLTFGNDAVHLDAAVLYADLDGSTKLVDNHKKWFSAEIYKSYLYTTARIIRNEGGVIVAYDGDRIMAVFIGDYKNTAAVRCALKINWAVQNIVTAAKDRHYGDRQDFTIRQVVGVDTGELWAARTGVRGANDLVWVGPAANYAAKLTELSSDYPTWITHRVYDKMTDKTRFASGGENMWEARRWTDMEGLSIYRSTYWWPVN